MLSALSCRDRNRLALTSEIMSAAALAGISNLLLMVSGDAVMLGDQPGQAKAVHDLDSVQALGWPRAGRRKDLSGNAEVSPAPVLVPGPGGGGRPGPLEAAGDEAAQKDERPGPASS